MTISGRLHLNLSSSHFVFLFLKCSHDIYITPVTGGAEEKHEGNPHCKYKSDVLPPHGINSWLQIWQAYVAERLLTEYVAWVASPQTLDDMISWWQQPLLHQNQQMLHS